MAGANPWLGGRLPQRDILTHFLNMQRVNLGADGSSVNNKSSYWSIMLAQNVTECMNHTYPRAWGARGANAAPPAPSLPPVIKPGVYTDVCPPPHPYPHPPPPTALVFMGSGKAALY